MTRLIGAGLLSLATVSGARPATAAPAPYAIAVILPLTG